MKQLAAIIVSLLIILLAMPPNLGILWGSTSLGLVFIPPTLTIGLILGLMILATKQKTAFAVLKTVNPFIIVFLVLATLSTIWSAEPDTTARRLYRLYAMTFACLSFVVTGWTEKRFPLVVRNCLTFLCVASICCVLLNPEFGIQPSKFGDFIAPELVGAWRGVTMQKNTLGSIACVAVIFWFHSLLTHQSKRGTAIIAILVASICLVKSRSSTSIFSAFFSVSVLLLLTASKLPASFKRLIPFLAATLTALLIVYSLAILNIIPGLSALIQPFVSLAGKDMSFSGRTEIWDIMRAEIGNHPWLGIGYSAFWTGIEPDVVNPLSPSFVFVRKMHFYPFSAHNGYMDTLNELGYLGGVALIAYIIIFFKQSLQLYKVNRARGSLFIVLLLYEFVVNLTEAHWWNLTNFDFFVITLATFDAARVLNNRPPPYKPAGIPMKLDRAG